MQYGSGYDVDGYRYEDGSNEFTGESPRISGRLVLVLTVLVPLLLALLTFLGFRLIPACGALADSSTYDRLILMHRPVAYYPFGESRAACDHSGNQLDGLYNGRLLRDQMPNGDDALVFSGRETYVTIEDHDLLSIPTSGILTIEAWIRVDTLQFAFSEEGNYVHWLGKGSPGQQEYAMRMYSYDNPENRPNRISGYAFNRDSGRGIGSYFQDPITAFDWILVTFVVNTRDVSSEFPMGYTLIYRDGVLRDQDNLAQLNIVPVNGDAPLQIGTREFNSFFQGAIGKVALYDYELSADQVRMHYLLMTSGVESLSPAVLQILQSESYR